MPKYHSAIIFLYSSSPFIYHTWVGFNKPNWFSKCYSILFFQNTINELQNSLEVKGKELNEVIALKENLDKERAVASSSQDELRSELDSLKQENSSLKVNLENLSKEKVDLEEQKEHIHKVI